MEDTFQQGADILCDQNASMSKRFRGLFILRNLGGDKGVAAMEKGFNSTDSALLKHEIAYCVGQLKLPIAIPFLSKVLENKEEDSMVRHEAGEALGAIGHEDAIDILKQYLNDPYPEVRETCELALARLEWLKENKKNGGEVEEKSPFDSIDPAPALPKGGEDEKTNEDTSVLAKTLSDSSLPLFQRYRAMFALRNQNTSESVDALTAALGDESALLRHEIGYVLGQMQHPHAVEALKNVVADDKEHAMVRHEAAEALGSIATPHALEFLKQYINDPVDAVRESCLVALDIGEYNTTDQFQIQV